MSIVLLERDRELEVLDRLVRDALAGEAVLALLRGPAGIGKTSLLAKAREKAAAAGFGRAGQMQRSLGASDSTV